MRITTKEQEELVLKNRGLVFYVVNHLDVARSDYEDMISIGTIGLIKAAITFDQSKKIVFSTYATKCIKNEIYMYYRSKKSRPTEISLDDPVYENEKGEVLTLAEIIPSSTSEFTEEILDREIFIKILSIILNLLKPRDRMIMLYNIAGANQILSSKVLHISQSMVSRIEKRLKNDIKTYLTESQQYKEVYSMSIVGNTYQISFASNDKEKFNKIFAEFLKKHACPENWPSFKVICNDERVIVRVPANREAFVFIAQIIQEIDNFSMAFAVYKKSE